MTFNSPMMSSGYYMYSTQQYQQPMFMSPSPMMQNYGGANCYSNNYCPPMQQPPQDSNAGLTAMMGQFFNMMMSILMTGVGLGTRINTDPAGSQDDPQIPPNTDPETDPNEDLDVNDNTDIMQIVSDNARFIPHKNGKITEQNLKDFLKKNPNLPDSTQQAIQNLVDNPELYNLLCLKSGSTPEKGFSTKVLDDSTDWGNLDVDNLDTVDDDKVWETLRNVNDNLKKIDGNTDNGVTLDDMKKVALGQVDDPKLKDPTVQAAALKFMFNDALKKKFDEKMGGTGDGQGQVWGDPHFVGDDGETYDVMGEAGKTYNILSDKGIQYNAQFQAYGGNGATTIGKAGIQMNQHKVEMDAHADAPTVDGQKMEKDKPVDLGNGSTAVWDGANLKITTPEYDITIKKNHDGNGDYLDQDIKAKNPYADGVAPHGLWGQTVDKDKDKKNTGTDKGKQGGTVIDGAYTDYETGDLWGSAKKADFNRFDPNATTDVGSDGAGGFDD